MNSKQFLLNFTLRFWSKLILTLIYTLILAVLCIYFAKFGTQRTNNISIERKPTNSEISNDNSSAFRIKILTLNRPDALFRLLKSLARANYYDVVSNKTFNIGLVISIDIDKTGQVNAGVLNLANRFSWNFGEKIVKVNAEQKGIIGQWIDNDDIFFETYTNSKDFQKTKDKLLKDPHVIKSPIYVYANRSSLDIFPFHDRRSDKPEHQNMYTLFLEDDMEVSKHYFTWLRGAIEKYRDKAEIAGYTLARAQLKLGEIDYKQPWETENHSPNNLERESSFDKNGSLWVDREGPLIPPQHKVFLYRLVASWALIPDPEVWRAFVTWYHRVDKKALKPVVKGLVITRWYLKYAGRGKSQAMWTQWYVYYCWQLVKLHRKTGYNLSSPDLRYVPRLNFYTLYTNFPDFMALAINWRQPGSHYTADLGADSVLIQDWDDSSFLHMNDFGEMFKLGFDGNAEF